jgi:hypothetical protein
MAADGLGPRRLDARNGYSVFYKGKTLLSRIDPIKQAETLAEQNFPLKSRSLYLCPSPLFGYGLSAILAALPPDSAVLCVEADKELALWTQKNFDPTLLAIKTLRLVYTGDPLALCDFIRAEWGSRFFRRVIMLRLNSAWQLAPASYDTMAAVIGRNIAIEWSNAMTLSRMGRLYARNAIRNLPLLAYATDIKGGGRRRPGLPLSPAASRLTPPPPLGATAPKPPRCPDHPELCSANLETQAGLAPQARSASSAGALSGCNVLVLGAGPSLDETLDALGAVCRAPKRCFIICVDTALQALYARAIQPDLVVALEAQHWNLRDFIGLDGWRIPIAMDLSALPATRSALGGEIFVFWTKWTPLRFFDTLQAINALPLELPALGSVGLSAVSLALNLGAAKVLCAGLDFSFTLDKYHCRDSPGHRAALRASNRLRSPVPAASIFRAGSFFAESKLPTFPARCDPAMKNYRQLFEEEFAATNKVFDITGSGLSLGVPILTYQQAAAFIGENTPDAAQKTGHWTDETPSQTPASQAAEPSSHGEETVGLDEPLEAFVRNEQAKLDEILAILQGRQKSDPETTSKRLESLLDETDYLWAHFPDCAAAGGRRPPATDIAFLKRIRAEIPPFKRLFSHLPEY